MLRRLTVLSLALALVVALLHSVVFLESVDAPIAQDSIQVVAGVWDD